MGELININKHQGRSLSPKTQSFPIVEIIKDKIDDQIGEKIIVPSLSGKFPLKKKHILYDSNIISSKGIKDYIKSTRSKNDDDNLIHVPVKKYVMHTKTTLKPKLNKEKIQSNNLANQQSDRISKKTLLVNKTRDFKRGNYGRNVALIRENANKIIKHDKDIEINEIQNKEDNKDIVNINININKDNTMIQLKQNKKTSDSVDKKIVQKTRHKKTNSCDIDSKTILEYSNFKKF